MTDTFDVNFRVHFPEVVHNAVQVQFTSTKNDMFSRFFHSGR